MITEQLFFIAIIPPEPIKGEIHAIKEDFANAFGATHALKSPPHITLIPPFKSNLREQPEIAKFLEYKAIETNSFLLTINGYSCFKPRVIYLNPIYSRKLETMQGLLQNAFYQAFPAGKLPKRPYHPHLTIGFRDLTPTMFYKAWPIYKSESYNAQFVVDRLCLLRHNGKIWEEFKEFPFNDAILPT